MEKQKNMSICKRIVSFIKRIFKTKDVLIIDSSKKEDVTIRKSVIEELPNQYKIMQLQKEYESGIIKEEDLSEYQKESLKDLYKKQIEILKTDIALKNKEFLSYKEKILKEKQNYL